MRENLAMTSPYVLPLESFVPLCFKTLEMIDKSESAKWANVWLILGADHSTFGGLWVISVQNNLQADFEGKKACNEIPPLNC